MTAAVDVPGPIYEKGQLRVDTWKSSSSTPSSPGDDTALVEDDGVIIVIHVEHGATGIALLIKNNHVKSPHKLNKKSAFLG